MNWFSSKKKKVYPTKMFVNYLPEDEELKSPKAPVPKSIGSTILTTALGGQSIAIDMVLNAAPKLIEQGMELMSKTLNSLANDKAFPTIVRRNFDTITQDKVSLPNKISLVRGQFANNANTTKKGFIFGDGENQARNQVVLLGNKELHIEIDVIQSKDKSTIYFQTNSYFYVGKSPEGDKIDEIVLAFAFLPAGQAIVNPKKDFKNFLHFEALEANVQYNFKSKSGYDTSFQSPWMTTPLDNIEPYTMVIQIQEIRAGNSFAKLLQTIYIENETYIKTGLNEKVNTLKKDSDKK